MSLKNYSPEQIEEMSMLEIANLILIEENKATNFREIFDRIAEMKGFTQKQKDESIAQFYTDLNIDGRFMTIGSNLWGLKRWYPVDQFEEEITAAPKKKKKKATRKKKVTKDLEEDLDEEELDFDDDDLDSDLDDFDSTDDDDADDSDDDYDSFDDDELSADNDSDDEEDTDFDSDDEDFDDDEDEEEDK